MKPTAAISEAMQHHQKGDLEKAEASYRELVSNKCTDKRVYVNLAAILRQKNNPKEAAFYANEGLAKADKNSPILFNTLANALRDLSLIHI